MENMVEECRTILTCILWTDMEIQPPTKLYEKLDILFDSDHVKKWNMI